LVEQSQLVGESCHFVVASIATRRSRGYVTILPARDAAASYRIHSPTEWHMKEPATEFVQIVLKVSPALVAELNDLQEKFGATSRSEVIRKGIGLLRLLQRAREQGADLAIVAADGVPQKVLVA
jgi:nucleotide-binding universal stress UspA family protein